MAAGVDQINGGAGENGARLILYDAGNDGLRGALGGRLGGESQEDGRCKDQQSKERDSGFFRFVGQAEGFRLTNTDITDAQCGANADGRDRSHA